METPNRFAFLRQVLFADAIGSGVCVIALLAFSGPLSRVLELPAPLLLGSALALVPFVALVTAVAWPRAPRSAGVWLAIGLNAAWAVASILLAVSGEVTPNALGWAFLAAQTLFVIAAADLEYVGLRRAQGDFGGNSRRSKASVGAPT